MKETDYTYAVAYIRTLEKKMLTNADYDALLSAGSLSESLQILSAKGYGNGITELNFTAETLLQEELSFTWNEVRKACPKDAPTHILLYQNDFHNLKTILKAVFSNVDYKPLMLEPHTISPDAIHRAIAEGKPGSLPDILKKPAAEAYQILAREGDGQAAEIVLDKALFAVMGETAKNSQSDFLIGWVDLMTALANTKTAFRGGRQDAMLGGGQILSDAPKGSITALECWCDNKIIKYLQSAQYKAFGFAPILAFLINKQFELQSVRIILSGLKSGIPAEVLRERLRAAYV